MSSFFCAGILNDVLSLILHCLKRSSIVVALSDHEQREETEEERAKEKLLQKAYQFLAAFARLVPFLYACMMPYFFLDTLAISL